MSQIARWKHDAAQDVEEEDRNDIIAAGHRYNHRVDALVKA